MSTMIRKLTVSLLMAAVFAVAVPVATFQLQRSTPGIQFTDTRLDNGLRVIISEDRSAPVFSIAVNYNVGSRDERKGRTGFAHFFEHMMFKGSANVGPGEHPYLIFMYGGNMNGTTSKDRTVYYETLPANQLDLALFLEADRMRSLEVTKRTSRTSGTRCRKSGGWASTTSLMGGHSRCATSSSTTTPPTNTR